MKSSYSDTIFALSSAPGRGGVAVVRVSGGKALESFKALASHSAPLIPRCSTYTKLVHPDTGEILDQALAVYYKAPASFTGEDVVEYFLHGGVAVIQSVLSALARQSGHRMAQPGEFTRRAFENGKLDLTEAEAVTDLIDAQTQAQQIQALAQMSGALSVLYGRWTEELKKTLAHLEADIEFPDEDLPAGLAPEVQRTVQHLITEFLQHLSDNRRGERLRDGIHVAVIGAPNAGKSSLVNALAQRDIAIVSPFAGTTRDVIEAHLDIGGFPVILADTAGLRPEQLGDTPQDDIESEGIRRALDRAHNADITLLVFDATADMPDPHTLNLIDERAILVSNKIDDVLSQDNIDTALRISAKTGHGINTLIKALEDKIRDQFAPSEVPSLTRARHRAHVEEALACLERSRGAALPELAAEDLRLALRALGRITGKVDVEDVLDVIFNDFCVGK